MFVEERCTLQSESEINERPCQSNEKCKMPSTVEDLPNELFLFIFDYLSVIDLLWAFTHLNRRLSTLIRTLRHLHVDFSSKQLSKTQFIHVANQLRLFNVEFIRISNRYSVDAIPLFISLVPLNQLVHLNSLALIDIDRTSLKTFLQHYPRLTSLTIESVLWRSIPHRILPHFSHLKHCHLPTIDLLNGCHSTILDLTLDQCTSDQLTRLSNFVPNLFSLTLTLSTSATIPSLCIFPVHLTSLTLSLRSVLFSEFERLITMVSKKPLKNLTISFRNSECDVHCSDQYLYGKNWHSISQNVVNLQLSVVVYRTWKQFIVEDLLRAFDWFQRKLVCQLISEHSGYHLFSLPLIDRIYATNLLNDQNEILDRKSFHRVDHLHLTIPNENCLRNVSTLCHYSNLRKLTLVIPSNIDSGIISALRMHSHLRTLELCLNRESFIELIHILPSSIDTLILNTTTTRFLIEFLENNDRFPSSITCLRCSVKNRDHFDTLILLLLEMIHRQPLIYLRISIEHPNNSRNLLPNWLLKTNSLKRARVKCTERQCAIWI